MGKKKHFAQSVDASSHLGNSDAPPVRKGEELKVQFRSSRVYQVDDAWYFSTREGINLGPYATREDAE